MANDPQSMRTALGRVRHLGSARSGTDHAWAMRVTSTALLPLTIGFVWLVLSLIGKDHAAVRTMFAGQIFPVAAMALFIGVGVYHMKLGMQTIIEDYVHSEQTRAWAIILNLFFCVIVATASVLAIAKLGLAR